MLNKDKKAIKEHVKKSYSKFIAEGSSCSCSEGSCCGPAKTAEEMSKSVGYGKDDMSSVPDGANLGFGCGNPVAIASIKEGETVLDLGSGAGFDAFLAAQKVGQKGKVIGVDMTPDMIKRACSNSEKGSYKNVEFRLGEIENLPVEDSSVDTIISNCVINLSPDKPKVFKEAFRVLKPGGRLMVSDIVLKKELPDYIKNSPEAYAACISGALLKEEYLGHIKSAGFDNISIVKETPYDAGESSDYIFSVSVSASKAL